ncbi:MAG: glycosyltransferase family 87 protein [Pseudonocardiales bacterium]
MKALVVPVALGVILCADAALFGVLIEHTEYRHHALRLYCLATPLFALAVVLLARCRLPRRAALLVIFGAGIVLQVIAVSQHTTTTDDDYRYIWDAKVQLAGIDPYRYAPTAPELAPLREEFLFPGTRCPHRVGELCSAVNRPTVHTVYPPVAEAAFVAIRLASFGGQGHHFPVQLAGALGMVAIGALLARHALARDRPLWPVALWLWCPLPIMEYSNAGHIDWLAILLTVLGLGLAASRRSVAGGLLLGAAIATKLYPLVVLPALLRRRPLAVLGACVGLVALSYLPHVLAVGTDVIGYLPGYLREEQYTSGDRYLLLGEVLPSGLDTVAGVLVLGALAWWYARRADPAAPENSAVVLMGAVLLVTTPVYGWYAGLLLALVVLSGALEWLPVALAPTLIYLIQGEFGLNPGMARVVYASAALLSVAGYLLRRRHGVPTRGRPVQPAAGLAVR